MASILNVDQINNAAGTSAITIDANGNALMAGHVVQVVNGTFSGAQTSTSSTSYITTGLTASITPLSTSSKILITPTLSAYNNSGGSAYLFATIYRNSTNLISNTYSAMVEQYVGTSDQWQVNTWQWMDSPNTTSPVTYTVYYRSAGGGTVYIHSSSVTGSGNITLMEIAQ